MGIAPIVRAATQAEVQAAIARGQAFLLSKQKVPGRWEPDAVRQGEAHAWGNFQGHTWGGYTAVATYALLASGKVPQDADVAPAIAFLKTADIVGIYALGMRAQVWTYLPRNPETEKLCKRDAALILNSLNTDGSAAGLWDYDDPTSAGGRIDHSVSQFGVLGLWSCAQGGAVIEPRLWKTFDDVWRSHQYSDGGWSYDGNGNDDRGSTPAMTAAGIATLFITQEYLPSVDGLNCVRAAADDNIDRGLQWISDNFKQVGGNNYLWYGIERIGAASGRKYFGGLDWYAQGTEAIVRSQKPDGSWQSAFPGASEIPDTAFALLFLSRGRAPVVMNKLHHGDAVRTVIPTAAATTAPAEGVEAGPTTVPSATIGDWNQRTGDVAHLTRWLARKTERYLGWQVVDLSGSVRDLLDAPILYISGSARLNFDEREVNMLRQFVEEGGLIVGNADCGKRPFAASFRSLGKKLFSTYSFRELPKDHLILAGEQRWKGPIVVEGLSNGSRELMLLIPTADPARAWQMQSYRQREPLFEIGANIYFYATDKRSERLKGDTHLVRDLGITPDREIGIARLQVGKNWDPEPGGWRRLTTLMKNQQRLALRLKPVKPGDGTLSYAQTRVAHLTGTEAFQLTKEQRAELKRFVDDGGMLVMDAAGGSTAFADSAEREIAEILGKEAAKALATPLDAGDFLYLNPAAPIKRFGYRQAAALKLRRDMKIPRLRGIMVNKRLGVILSREDLSTGLVGHAVDGVIGYEPPSASALMRNIILYAGGIYTPSAAPTGDGLE